MRRLSLPLGLILLLPFAALAQDAAPRYAGDKELIRPEGYREWVFIGATLGMSYREGEAAPGPQEFHNLYIAPAAYREFKKSGKFPEGTMLVMEKMSPGSRVSPNQRGNFEDQSKGIEVALKDSSHFAESWAYFNFIQRDGSPATAAKAFAKESCWACHNEHAATDNVFTQFYPVLRKP
jgi:Cytochrome P460